MPAKILIIDDEPNVCWSLSEYLKDQGFVVETASSAEEGLEILRSRRLEVVLLDIILPGMSGLEMLDLIAGEGISAIFIIMTAHGTMSTAIEAIQKGAYEYLTKPFDLEKVRLVIQRALEARKLSAEVVKLRSKLAGEFRIEDIMVGGNSAMHEVYKKIGAVASSDVTVLLVGESGTGKELTARAVHFNSKRKSGPFVPINCGSLPESLLESELFGHEKGAFTGAVSARMGKFEKANHGTIFLDEIGDLSPAMQVALLRFLEDKTIERVGSNDRICLDIRVIAASNCNLEELVSTGEFREDLYYRLKVVDILLPPLRERLEDVPLLVAYFLARADYPTAEISTQALEILISYHWPGNVRELRNAIEHAGVFSRGAVILAEHLPLYLVAPGQSRTEEGKSIDNMLRRLIDEVPAKYSNQAFEKIMEVWEEPLIRLAMQKFSGNQVKASQFLGIHRTTFRNKLKKYGLM
ncbi:sigma-54-dependent transcriptional regulator [Planctomycetota bacterium]